MTTCPDCQKPITDLETYGDIDCPMCWECHSSCMFVTDRQQQEAAGQLRLL